MSTLDMVNLKTFLDTIIMRAERGTHMHELQLAKCRNLTADQVEVLSEVVADVDCDGPVGSCHRHACLCNDYHDSDSDPDD